MKSINFVKFGGTLTPSEAAQANTSGDIPYHVAKYAGEVDFFTRLTAEYRQEPEGPARDLMKAYLAACGRGSNMIACSCFSSLYIEGIKKLGLDEEEVKKHGIDQFMTIDLLIKNFWKRDDIVFMAAYVAYIQNPPALYRQRLREAVPRNSKTKEIREALVAPLKPPKHTLQPAPQPQMEAA